jgi:rubredoxin
MRLEGIVHDSALAGARTQLHRCTVCSYGASRSAAPERCPMCGESSWEFEDWRQFSTGEASHGKRAGADVSSASFRRWVSGELTGQHTGQQPSISRCRA